ncbi:MAG: hypothetical protein QS721_07490 [Candidatus Endonucleobacter sp. (ex Gigantidas childressi)]|nr:hypothetical protein [Candidatus Endonucleobacter sp. (ex Gigantidas childressi)]
MKPISGSTVNQANQAKIQQSSPEKASTWSHRSVKTARPKSSFFQGMLLKTKPSRQGIKNRRVKQVSNAPVKQQNIQTMFAKGEKSAPKKAENTNAASLHKNDKVVMDRLTKAGKSILNDLKQLNTAKKDMQKLTFNSSRRREAALDINLKKRDIESNVKRFNAIAEASGNTDIMMDMRTIEMGLLEEGNKFLENNKALKPFSQG